ncbi:CrcB protein [Rippkaea orientalis PCC 8801]|uniref:Fluoride-specific ion channel FluC n=1 Tax=Rippkaea orientalis (strain PCC 8801 / RF-1) TaxID=41431 RepID=B7K4M6_RIPO1|nr:fluoride efflux transporter CrcB [Rippkaea orientalis]ACK65491.1 CrcB protein [Rippkaea orientalis PCC 8801]
MPNYLQFLIVFLGGGLGSCSRYVVSKVISSQLESIFPWGTFTVNIIGCFLIGIFIGMIQRFQFHPNLTVLLVTGFCGGFTTFSSFSYENYLLLKNSEYLLGLLYTFMSLCWGFAATFLAIFLIRRF